MQLAVCGWKKSSPLGRIRTSDQRFRKPVLYPLSYEGYIHMPAGHAGESISCTARKMAA